MKAHDGSNLVTPHLRCSPRSLGVRSRNQFSDVGSDPILVSQSGVRERFQLRRLLRLFLIGSWSALTAKKRIQELVAGPVRAVSSRECYLSNSRLPWNRFIGERLRMMTKIAAGG